MIRHVTIFECDACGFRRDEEGGMGTSPDHCSIHFDIGGEARRPVVLLLCDSCTKKVKKALVAALGELAEKKFAQALTKPKVKVSTNG